MYDNEMGHAGACALFLSLRDNQTLLSLDLSSNTVATDTAMALFKDLLTVNHTLESVFLWKTGLEDGGAVALAEGLAENRGIKRLELRSNAMTAAGLMALSQAVNLNDSIFKLMVDVPLSSDKDIEALGIHEATCALPWCRQFN